MNWPEKRGRGQGKKQLIHAALKLAAEKRSFSSIGLRELGREAGLNPNTFYRHFANMDELGVSLVEEVGKQLRDALRQTYPRDTLTMDSLDQALDRMFQLALEYRDAFIVAACERYSSTPAVRAALAAMFERFRDEVVHSIITLGVLEELPEVRIHELTRDVIHYCFRVSIDYLEEPEQRSDIRRSAKRYILTLFSGALFLESQNPHRSSFQ